MFENISTLQYVYYRDIMQGTITFVGIIFGIIFYIWLQRKEDAAKVAKAREKEEEERKQEE